MTHKNCLRVLILSFVFGVSGMAMATNNTPVVDLKVQPLEGNDLQISWSAASDEVMKNQEGYAIQWGDQPAVLRADQEARQMVGRNITSIVVRYPVRRDRDYWFRVYTYEQDGRYTYLNNGSKLMTWRYTSSGEVVVSKAVVTDPTVTRKPSVNSDGSSSGDLNPVNEKGEPITFGVLSSKKYDTWIIFTWSRPNLASSTFDGFTIKMSKSADMSDPVAIMEARNTDQSLKVMGLEADTTYYAQGFFRYDGNLYGEGSIKTFKTDRAYTEAQQARLERLKLQRLVSDLADKDFTIGVNTNATTTTTNNTDTTTSSNSDSDTTTSTSTTTSTNSNTNINTMTITQLETKISALKRELATLEAELRKKQPNSRTTATSRTLPTARRSPVSIPSRGRGPIIIPYN